MRPLKQYKVELYDVTEDCKVTDFLRSKFKEYKLESGYHQLTNPEHIPDDTEVIFIDKVCITSIRIATVACMEDHLREIVLSLCLTFGIPKIAHNTIACTN